MAIVLGLKDGQNHRCPCRPCTSSDEPHAAACCLARLISEPHCIQLRSQKRSKAAGAFIFTLEACIVRQAHLE